MVYNSFRKGTKEVAMKGFFAGVVTVLVVLAVAGYVYLMTPPWVKQDLTDKVAVMLGYKVVKKADCAWVVAAAVHEKSRFSWPPRLVFTWYNNQVMLEDGRTRTFDSTFIYKVGEVHCVFWTEYIRKEAS